MAQRGRSYRFFYFFWWGGALLGIIGARLFSLFVQKCTFSIDVFYKYSGPCGDPPPPAPPPQPLRVPCPLFRFLMFTFCLLLI